MKSNYQSTPCNNTVNTVQYWLSNWAIQPRCSCWPNCMRTQERQFTRFFVFYNLSTKKTEPTFFSEPNPRFFTKPNRTWKIHSAHPKLLMSQWLELQAGRQSVHSSTSFASSSSRLTEALFNCVRRWTNALCNVDPRLLQCRNVFIHSTPPHTRHVKPNHSSGHVNVRNRDDWRQNTVLLILSSATVEWVDHVVQCNSICYIGLHERRGHGEHRSAPQKGLLP